MKYPIYSYRDKKVGFMPPQCEQSEQAAVRGFSYGVNGNSGIMNFAPADYDLYKVGEFDTESGQVTACLPEFIVNGASVFAEDK